MFNGKPLARNLQTSSSTSCSWENSSEVNFRKSTMSSGECAEEVPQKNKIATTRALPMMPLMATHYFLEHPCCIYIYTHTLYIYTTYTIYILHILYTYTTYNILYILSILSIISILYINYLYYRYYRCYIYYRYYIPCIVYILHIVCIL